MIGIGEGHRESRAGLERAKQEGRGDLVAVFNVTGQRISDAGRFNGMNPSRQRRFSIEATVEDGGACASTEGGGVGQSALEAWHREATDDGVQHSEAGHSSYDAKEAKLSYFGDGFNRRLHGHEAKAADVEPPIEVGLEFKMLEKRLETFENEV